MAHTVSIGINALDTARNDVCLDLPAHSPVTHGMLRIVAEVEDDRIVHATPVLGSMHRGAEKLFESRDYRQILMLANRHEWLSPFSGEVGIAELLERALGIEVPTDAQQLRTLLLAFTRVTSHLAFLGGYPWADNNITGIIRQHRELWLDHFQKYVGTRMHPMITRIGGLTHAPTNDWVRDITLLTQACDGVVESLRVLLEADETARGLGVITPSDVDEFALSGPAAAVGDVNTRLTYLVNDTALALATLKDLSSRLSDHTFGEVDVLLPKVLRVPEGNYEHSISTPLGIASWYLVSRGDKMPYRLALRPASLHTVLALSQVLEGARLADVSKIVASMPFLTGDAER